MVMSAKRAFTKEEHMSIRASATIREGHLVKAKIGNAADCRKAISDAIERRAYEIYQHQGCRPGQDRHHWRLAESEIVQPLSCGVSESSDDINISAFSSVLGTKDIDEIEVCVEPHYLMLVGKKQSVFGEDVGAVRVLPLKDEFDPSSVKLRQNGPCVESEIRRSRVGK
jgi:Protein of unknown function (DUF2934)